MRHIPMWGRFKRRGHTDDIQMMHFLVSSLKLQVSFAKEPYKIDDILQKRPIILR